MDSLGDRIKCYEAVTRHFATPRMPLIIRLDGRAFHTFTRNLQRPFDENFIDAMTGAALQVAKEMQGFKVAYIQSDEVTFCITDYDELNSQGWFGYNLQKILSISASTMSVNFIKTLGTDQLPVFDSRAFSVPISDVVNTFLWRAKDWERNSLQMYSRAFFSHKELHRQNTSSMHNMLKTIDKSWANDLSPKLKNGTFLIDNNNGIEIREDIKPNYRDIAAVINPLIK